MVWLNNIMRIYLVDNKSLQSINLLSLAKYQTAQKQFTRFYTDKGIFNMNGNSIHKVNILDGNISSTKLNLDGNILHVIMDDSKEIIDKTNIYHLPYGYIPHNITEATYRLSEHAQQKLIILFDKHSNIIDYYFEINLSIDCYEVTHTFSTFLSII